MIRDGEHQEQKETVDIIASGYEWICPECETLNEVIEYPKTGMVQCEGCGKGFCTDLPEHCFG